MDRTLGGWFAASLRRIVTPGLGSLLLALAFVANPAGATTDLGITLQTSNPTPVAGGAAFAYTITVTNYGPDNALGVVVLDPLPPSIKIANANIAVVNLPSVPGWGLICESPPVNTVGGTIKCTGNMPAPAAGPVNSTATITIVAQVVEDTASGVRTNTATVASNTVESTPNTNPNTASVQVNMQVNAQLSLAMAATPTVIAGDPILYQIALSNNGNSAALNPAFTQQLPPGTQFLALFGTRDLHDACYAAGGGAQVTCAPKTLASGTHYVVVLAETFLTTPEGGAQSTTTLTSPGTGTPLVPQANATTEVDINEPPVAVDDNYLTNKDTPLVVATLGVKINDSDDEDSKDVLVSSLVAGPAHGTLTVPLGANGSFTYTPNAGFTGADSFTYIDTDSRGLQSNVATVRITVNAPPVAVDDAYLTNKDTPLVVPTLGVKANDTDDLDTKAQLAASLVLGPANGSLTVPLNANGSFTYTPNAGFTGVDTFTYLVTDTGGLQSNVATVRITVNAPPVAVDDQYTMLYVDGSISVAPLGVKANDSDDLDTKAQLAASLVAGPGNGTLIVPLAADGSFTYAPNVGFSGFDSFTYVVTDTNGLVSNTATVSIWVTPPPADVPLSPWTAALAALTLAMLGAAALRGRRRPR